LNLRMILLVGLIVAAAVLRVVPHPWNFAPVTAIALLGGACFPRAWHAFAVCLGVMVLSDIALSFRPEYPLFYADMVFVYAAFAAVVAMGLWLRRRRRLLPVAGMTLAASVQFFIVTNFGVWAMSTMYPHTLSGLGQAYAAGIPFFRNALAGDLLFTLGLFGFYALLERTITVHARRRAAVDVHA
jgi:hypothetical protein